MTDPSFIVFNNQNLVYEIARVSKRYSTQRALYMIYHTKPF